MWLTLDELSKYLKLSRTNLYRMVQQGKIPTSKIEFQWRFNRKEIDDWVTSQRPSAAASQGREHGNGLKAS
ncbi:MAG: hypothetical protein K940chlam7_00446 [Chlamydiae bacterium]|nr:hypothetical protein [Chlamydiota bacterium]